MHKNIKAVKIQLINNDYYEARVYVNDIYLNIVTSDTLDGIMKEIKKKEIKYCQK